MRVAIVGSRNYGKLELVRERVRQLLAEYGDDLVILTGGARGVDTVAEEEGRKLGVTVLVDKAEWDKFGRKAGPMRNARLAYSCDRMIAFWDGESRGTQSAMNHANHMVKPLEVIR